MLDAPRLRSMSAADSEVRPVLGPAGNKAGSRKTATKPLRKAEKSPPMEITAAEKKKVIPLSPKARSTTASSVLGRHDQLLHSNLSLNASCSSDASTDSLNSRASTGRLIRSNSAGIRRKPSLSKARSVASDSGLDSPPDGFQPKKRCAWVTPSTEPCYAAFHDEEWGVPVHDDEKLFELLVLSSTLSELTWPAILSKRHLFRDIFSNFDPAVVSKLNEKKLIASGSSLLSEMKLRAITENARQILKVIDEFGSFNNYIWSFVNHKPIVSKFRYPRQVPAKTPKADLISKDMVRRGFRSVGPTVAYSFMQVAGITNDHLTSCFRFQECLKAAEIKEEKDEKAEERIESELSIVIDELNFSSE